MFRALKILAAFTIVLLLLVGLAGCTAVTALGLTIQVPWSRPTAMGGNAVIYFTIVNKGNVADALVGASSNVAETVGIHETRMEGNIMRMVPVSRIEVPAGRRTELAPGGFHMMLTGLKQDISPGDAVSVTLLFEKSEDIVVAVEVRKP